MQYIQNFKDKILKRLKDKSTINTAEYENLPISFAPVINTRFQGGSIIFLKQKLCANRFGITNLLDLSSSYFGKNSVRRKKMQVEFSSLTLHIGNCSGFAIH